MTITRTQSIAVFLLWVFIGAGCAVWDMVPQPKTTAEKIGLAITNINLVRQSASEQFDLGNLSVDKAQKIQATLAQARSVTDTAADVLNLGQEQDALVYLDMAQGMLSRVKVIINSKEGQP